jgi:hypothetical protein
MGLSQPAHDDGSNSAAARGAPLGCLLISRFAAAGLDILRNDFLEHKNLEAAE